MIHLTRTNSGNPDFLHLVSFLDSELAKGNGDEQAFFDQFNKLDSIHHVVIAYNTSIPVGCGAIRIYSDGMAEIKRMYVNPDCRGQGIAGYILNELESWAKELNLPGCILETGKQRPEAIQLYQKNGYTIIPNYGQYENVKSSVCMKKIFGKP